RPARAHAARRRHGAPALRERPRGTYAPSPLRLRRGRYGDGDRMTSLDDRKERVRRAYEGLARGDGQGLLDLFAPDVVYTVIGTRAFTVPAEREALLRLMDLNMCEMFREIVRLGRGGELLETPALTLCASPHGTPFHNMTIVRDAVDADTVVAMVRDFYAR